jgi:cytochrome P450
MFTAIVALLIPTSNTVLIREEVFGYYRRMRSEGPVHRRGDGLYEVFDYDNVKYVLQHPEHFSSDLRHSNTYLGGQRGLDTSFILMDDPDHRELRSVAAPFFLTSRLAAFRSTVEHMSSELLDAVGEHSDLISSYASKLPSDVISHLHGVPSTDRERFR